MKSQLIVTITSDDLDEKQERVFKELLNSPALMERAIEETKKNLRIIFEADKRNDTLEVEIKKVED